MSRVLFVIEGETQDNRCHEDLPEGALPRTGQTYTPARWKGRSFKVLGRGVALVLSSNSAEPLTIRLQEIARNA
jgi:hypothetical protein